MRNINIDSAWTFGPGLHRGNPTPNGMPTEKIVNLPHDYMIESNTTETAAAGPASGYYTAGVAHYSKIVEIPEEWKDQMVYLHFDGVMMNATVDVNGGKVALQHYGYAPFSVDITPYVFFGRGNRITITVNPSMQPNCRWYSGAGIFRSVELIHMPKLHIAEGGLFGYTKTIEYDENGNPETAYLSTEVTVQNQTLENKMALVEVYLTRDGSDEVIISRKRKIQVNPNASETAVTAITLDDPVLWSAESPELYQLHAKVTDLGRFITHHIALTGEEAEKAAAAADESSVLFGIRTVTADARHGLRVNGKTVKLKGGCLHHDNGILGAVSLYDSEARKLSILKEIGFNAVRTTHNPPSSAFMEACDRLGIYVFDEAFDAWGIMKQPGDYNMFFDNDWEKDLTNFVKRDRNHPAVIIWSTGNEIPERGGLNNGYTLAKKLADCVRGLDKSRPVSNGICSYWSGLDDELTERQMAAFRAMLSGEIASVQNVDFAGKDTTWEEYSEAFTNGLDIVGYNYMEDKYQQDHEMFPERVILGSENYPKEIGKRWPMVENTPYVLGDFTWTAWDYIGEAGIGKSVFVEKDDPIIKMGPLALMSHTSAYPWRLANDADVDINGNILPQGAYRSVVWGSNKTYLYSYDPADFGKTELISMWGFTNAWKNWNWNTSNAVDTTKTGTATTATTAATTGRPVTLVVYSNAEEVEVFLNGSSIGRKKAGEALAVENLPKSFLFDTIYTPGQVTAISYTDGKEVSRDTLTTVGEAAAIRLLPETAEAKADGHSLIYVPVEITDAEGRLVPTASVKLTATVTGAGELLGFGSANPISAENYTTGNYTTYRGRALAIIRTTNEADSISLKVSAPAQENVCPAMEAAAGFCSR